MGHVRIRFSSRCSREVVRYLARRVAPGTRRGETRRERASGRAKGPRATGCDVLLRLNIDTQHATRDDEAAAAAAAANDACPLARLGSSTLWTLVKATTAIDGQDRSGRTLRVVKDLARSVSYFNKRMIHKTSR